LLRYDGSPGNRIAFLLAALLASVLTLRAAGDELKLSGSSVPTQKPRYDLWAIEPLPSQEAAKAQDADVVSTELAAENEELTTWVPQDDEIRSERDDSLTGTDYFQSDSGPGEGLVIEFGDANLKIGGYVKVDLIHDFNAIGSTDSFNSRTIPTDGRPGENTRLHARQTRLNLDFHPNQDRDDLQLFVEGDFFGEGDSFRLRHAYLRAGRLLAGQTWSTFMDESILPGTRDLKAHDQFCWIVGHCCA
jgi:hypothetical protein